MHIDGSGNAVGAIGPTDGRTIMIDGHIDSIPLHSKSRWTVDPFGGEVRDGALYGLGICDQKASIAAAIWGVAAAASALRQRVVVVASVCEEEMEGGALAEPIATMQPDFFVTSEPNDTRLCMGQRGRAKVEVQVTGRACHAGHAAVGLNAAACHGGADRTRSPRSAPDDPSPSGRARPQLHRRPLGSVPVRVDHSGLGSRPASTAASFPARRPSRFWGSLTQAAEGPGRTGPSNPQLEVGLVEAVFRTWTGEQFSLPEYAAAWWTPEDSALVPGAMHALDSVGLPSTPTHYSFCTNGSYAAGICGIPTIGFGVGVESMAHQVDEHVTLDSLRRGAQGYAALAAMAL